MMSPRLSKVFRADNGSKFTAILSAPEDRLEGSDIRARRILRAHRGAPAHSGTVAALGPDRYLLIWHSSTVAEKRFLALQVTDYVRWVRTAEGTNPVTLMPTNGNEMELHSALPIVLEPSEVVSSQGLEAVKYTIHTPGRVEPGDMLGPYQVQTAQYVDGVSILKAI